MSYSPPPPSAAEPASEVAVLRAELAKAREALAASEARLRAASDDAGWRKQAETLDTRQKRVLESIVRGAPLTEVLESIVRMVEEQAADDMFASILLLEEDGRRLRQGAAPSLPEAYNRAIDGLEIGAQAGSCGTAAHLKKPVFVSDVQADPLWEKFRVLAAEHGLRACWSTPFFSGGGELLGTLAMYYRTPREPQPSDLRLVDVATNLAAIAIERQRNDSALARARGEAEQQRRLFEAVLSSTPDFVYIFDLEHRFTYVNEALLAMWGRTREEALGRTCLELGYEPWHAAMHDREIEQVVATARPIRNDVPFTGTAGRRIYDYIFVPVFGAAGDVVAVAGTTRDVTERRNTEAELRLRTEQFETLLNKAPIGVFFVDADFRLQEANPVAQPVFGNLENLLGRDFAEVMHVLWPPERAAEIVQIFRHTLATGEPYRNPEFIQKRADREGTEYFDWRIARIALPSGRLGVVCYFADISEQVLARERLLARTAELESLLTSAPLGVAFFDREHRYLRINAALAAINGYPAPYHIGRTVEEVLPVNAAIVGPIIDRIFATGEVVSDFEITGETPREPGVRRHWLTGFYPVKDAHGQVDAVGVWVAEITNRKEAEEALARAKENAEAASRAKDNFLAALSHELRTPLTPVLMSAATLREDDRLPPDVREQLSMMERNIGLEARLIDDLLDLTRIAKGKLSLRPQLCDAHSLISLAVEIVRDDAQAKGLVLERDFAARHSGVPADPARFQQVIWNLLRNAVKFTPAGGRVTIRTTDLGEDRLHIEVIDSGIGIEPAALEKIFAPFEQAGAAGEHRFGGLGLGLAIARAIVELHGGEIHAESAGPGAGATFSVDLPGATEPPAGAHPHDATASAPQFGANGPALRLLLVEDHEETLKLLSRLLKRAGHQLSSASSVAAALEAAENGRFDLVISDLGLPDGTGIELMAKLRERHGLSGIALTGYGMEEDLERSRAAGFIAHLIKPVDFDQLRRTLRDVAPVANAST